VSMAKCSICQHPKRKEIDKALVSGTVSIRAVADQWHVGREALRRHVKNGHIQSKIQKAAIAQEKAEADDFYTHLQKRKTRFTQMAAEAKTAGNPHLELKVYQVESKFTEMEGKALGAFREKVEHSGKIELPLSNMSDEEVKSLARKVLTESD